MNQRTFTVIATFVVAVLALLVPLPEGLSEEARRAAIIGSMMAVFWMSEALPLPITALIPLVGFPLSGISSLDAVARSYAHPLIFLFLGGFMLAAAMQRWELHRRLALAVLTISGPSPRNQILAMMSGTAFLSLWISNTATAMVMLPIGLSMVSASCEQMKATGKYSSGQTQHEEVPVQNDPFAAALMLGIAFSATIGGMGSLIGTPPNALFAGFVERTYGISIGFGQWMAFGLPIAIVLLPITWLLLTRVVFHVPNDVSFTSRIQPAKEPLSRGQSIVAIVLVLTALAWILRPLISKWLGIPGLTDAGIAVAAALVLFLLPERLSGGRPLLAWNDVKMLRWDVLILFGGGLALAEAISSTGLAEWIGTGAANLRDLPIMVLVLIMMVVIVYLGELASNTAMAAIFLPIAGAAAIGLGTSPLTLVLPVAVAASLGFMLPVATPPNAIVYGTGAITSRQMLKAGAALDVISILIVFAFAVVLAPLVFDIEGGSVR